MPDKKLILIAEEDKMQATLLAFRLRRNGYRVEQVSHGEAALNFLKQYIPDMIICGIEMPGLHTFDLLKFARKRYNREVPIVVLTTSSENRLHSKLFEAGATECMTKPVDPSSFLDMVELELGQYKF
ncbi:response regulator [Robertkochia marina]|uniref:Response regulator n=1 Tax=Robertkochia marina TaxID=1227945 RepID=A0A4S3M315_9FLAO|nr:response regulator [Robertkochia marina]THD67885.1 response regulator [Robertkochia marina]TRZ42076.1 response regulator [Robertkochia marina]